MKTPEYLQGIGIPFYTEANWLIAKATMEDGHTFHANYAQFVQRVVQAELQLRREGKATIRINIDPGEFIAWCKSSARQVDAQSRSEFAALRAREMDKRGQG